eukprot:TRINITY_DN11899_c0_g1_i2.p1 TRINITY_DN11899_c0_g1~~TRINITY_DN11899_c0_g1_i2.p1  ORF type:complete len:388 (-),score=47.56 TRINITY_DN11899_c0_g1_i2:31-1194(-)
MFSHSKMLRSSLSVILQVTRRNITTQPADARLESFRVFNANHGKFRVAIVNRCDFNCSFCHNEGMENPREPGKPGIRFKGKHVISDDILIDIMNTYARLGGSQINVTGGEPLVHPRFVDIINSLQKRNSRVILNSNVMLADRLLHVPKLANIDGIYASLHTTSEEQFRKVLGTGGAKGVMKNMVSLRQHGYDVQINYSLGDYNKDEFDSVMDFALANSIHLKAIAIIRPDDNAAFYKGSNAFVNPQFVQSRIDARGLHRIGDKSGFGGTSTIYNTRADGTGTKVEVKNIAKGRLFTDFCGGCKYQALCGEGMYAVRVGVDALWKPCLMRKERFSTVQTKAAESTTTASTADGSQSAAVTSYEDQILDIVHQMVGDWSRMRMVSGAPQ